ncbi:hypothetical protein [Lysobacter gummosus]|uniref:hypothetical protein n=1 Tax=Lysobacter gummosus TaxID=262324 RepID=UPI00364293F2
MRPICATCSRARNSTDARSGRRLRARASLPVSFLNRDSTRPVHLQGESVRVVMPRGFTPTGHTGGA